MATITALAVIRVILEGGPSMLTVLMTMVTSLPSVLMEVTGESTAMQPSSSCARRPGTCPAPPNNNQRSGVCDCGPTFCVQAMCNSDTSSGSKPPDPPMRACMLGNQCV